ncbi:MAG: hypothetical protein J7K95_06405 [Thermoplasmata archaeon]|nr:hypothetical protein [Thermoplasmata archaeon]
MIEREYIIKKVKSLPENSIKKLAKYIESLEKEEKKKDPLAKAIGICEGPSDLAEKHDKYIYG